MEFYGARVAFNLLWRNHGRWSKSPRLRSDLGTWVRAEAGRGRWGRTALRMGQRVKRLRTTPLTLLFRLLPSLTQSPAGKHTAPRCAHRLPVRSLLAEAHTPPPVLAGSLGPESSATCTGRPLPQGGLAPASVGTLPRPTGRRSGSQPQVSCSDSGAGRRGDGRAQPQP